MKRLYTFARAGWGWEDILVWSSIHTDLSITKHDAWMVVRIVALERHPFMPASRPVPQVFEPVIIVPAEGGTVVLR